MSEVHFLSIDIANRLYTQNCSCVNLKKLFDFVLSAASEKNIEKYLKARSDYINNYINSIFVHTVEPLVDKRSCRQKDFVLSNTLYRSLKEHLFTLSFVKEDFKKEGLKKYNLILPSSASTLLSIFGSPGIKKSIEISDYIEFTSNFIKTSLQFHEKLVKTHTPAIPRDLISFLKLEVLTLRIYSTYFLKIRKNGSNQNGLDKMEESSNTPI